MKVYRIARTEYAKDLSGTGAKLYGGRWNHPGTPVIYASQSRSLATVEYLVHVPRPFAPADLSIVTLNIPDDVVPEEIQSSSLPKGWRRYPAPTRLADLGTAWALSKRSLLLRVPSAVVESEQNLIINPDHPEISRVVIDRVEKFHFDDRLAR